MIDKNISVQCAEMRAKMKIKKGFIVRQINNDYVVAAVGEQSKNFNGIIRLNQSAKFIWDMLECGSSKQDIVHALLENYEIDEKKASEDVEHFIQKLEEAEILE